MKKVHIDVDKDVRERLGTLKERLGLDFTDIISMALTFLEQKEPKIRIESDIARVTVNVKKAHLHTAFAQTLMDKGYDIFIPKINARQAHYIKRKLQKELNANIILHPVTVAKEDGYLLMFTKSQIQHT